MDTWPQLYWLNNRTNNANIHITNSSKKLEDNEDLS
jgi:hypothetical protein